MRSRNSRDGGQIKTSYAHTTDRCLNITAVDVLRIAGQGAATLDPICATRDCIRLGCFESRKFLPTGQSRSAASILEPAESAHVRRIKGQQRSVEL
jgi:hypothetical protein